MHKLKTIIVMPSYNSEATFKKTILDIPFKYVDEVVFVDDASKDNTILLLKSFCEEHPKFTLLEQEYKKNSDLILFTIHIHKKNLGYGGNQKSCYDIALGRGADIIIMIHPDYQYDPKLSKYFVEYIGDGYFDVMLGSRIRSRKETLAGGMPVYKYYANRFLSLIENLASGHNLSEWHSGMRAYKREVLEKIPYKDFSDDFIFDTQVMFSAIEKGFKIGDIPVPVRYFREASSINLKRSLAYGFFTLWETSKFLFRKIRYVNKKNS
jgi:glycosyltransferase involved in cell wall biosynthesis